MTHISLILTVTVLIACNSLDKKNALQPDVSLENKFEQLTNKARSDTEAIIFRLDTLTSFSWDSVIIITPYSQIDKLEEKTKINLAEVKNTKIVADEVSNVLAFVKRGQVIKYVDLPRAKGDFANISDNNGVFTKGNCLFELVQTENKFASGQTIVIVKPINKRNHKNEDEIKNAL